MGGTWTGSFAPGQPVINGKKSVYDFMTYWNVVNADSSRGEKSPEDNLLRDTVIYISTLANAPVISIIDEQAPDTDSLPQYEMPVVSFDSNTGIVTITGKSNGWVKYNISNLVYNSSDSEEPTLSEQDEEAVKQQK